MMYWWRKLVWMDKILRWCVIYRVIRNIDDDYREIEEDIRNVRVYLNDIRIRSEGKNE